MGSVEIFYDDLNEEAQERVLEAAGVEDPDDMNWDTMPLTIVEFEEE